MSFFARLLRQAWARTPKTPFDAGVAAFDRDRFDEALTHFSFALKGAAANTQRALIHNKRALIYLRQGDRPAAIGAFADALAADARCVAAIVNVGNLLLEDGMLDDAVAHYEAALCIDDAYAAAHLNLGIAYKRLGRRADAVREFRRANRVEAPLRVRRQ